MIFRGFCLEDVCAAPFSCFAQNYPAAFQVTGVAGDDRISIRSAPSASSNIVGAISPYGLNIKVLESAPNEKRGKVGLPEGSGWVTMRNLEETPPAEPYLVPRPLSCFGTEPFWSLGHYPRGAEYNSPETGIVPMTILAQDVSERGYVLRLDEGPTLNRAMIVKRQRCGDGMSDRAFGLTTLMFLGVLDGNGTLTDCYSHDHR